MYVRQQQLWQAQYCKQSNCQKELNKQLTSSLSTVIKERLFLETTFRNTIVLSQYGLQWQVVKTRWQMDSTTFGGGAGAAEISSFASPLEQVFRNVPKAHEKPLRQAVYNVRLLVSPTNCLQYTFNYVIIFSGLHFDFFNYRECILIW